MFASHLPNYPTKNNIGSGKCPYAGLALLFAYYEAVTQVEELQRTEPSHADVEERDRMSHIVLPASAVTEAIITGKPCTALCGKTWVPSRDPKKYPLCPTCREVAESMGWKIPNS